MQKSLHEEYPESFKLKALVGATKEHDKKLFLFTKITV
jgi:hypothetical protein